MFHQRTRDLYFAALPPLNKLNDWRWRARRAVRNGSVDIHLHLGCGVRFHSLFVECGK